MKKNILIAIALFTVTLAKAQVISQSTISLEAAKKIVAEAVKYAKSVNAPGGAIAVVDNGGHLIYLKDWMEPLQPPVK